MIKLYVSYDAGCHYHLDSTAKSIEELASKTKQLDDDMLRWYTEEGGEMTGDLCSIHQNILDAIGVK